MSEKSITEKTALITIVGSMLLSTMIIIPYGTLKVIISQLFSIGALLSLMVLLAKKRKFEAFRLLSAFILVVYSIWIFIPFRPHDSFSFAFIIPFTAMLILLFNDNFASELISIMRKIVGIICIPTILLFFLLLFGIEVPWVEVPVNFKDYGNYKFYYIGSTILSTQVVPLPWGGEAARMSGLFQEPGHLGIICGILLSVNRFKIVDKYDKFLLLGGALSFSITFYIIIVFGVIIFNLVYFSKHIKTIAKIFFLAIIVGIVVNVILPEYIAYRLYLRHFEILSEGGGIFERAIDNPDQGFGLLDYLVGKGRYYFESINGAVSDYRRLAYRYGYIGLIILMAYYFTNGLWYKQRAALCFIFFAILFIGLHRVFMIEQLWFLVFAIAMADYSEIDAKKIKANFILKKIV